MLSRIQTLIPRIIEEVEYYRKTTIHLEDGDPHNILTILSLLGYEYGKIEENTYEVINAFTKEQ